ncbi:MAG: hypothetical protein JXO44_03685 [Clostridia bacterium]|nr:hypothetical protein [Clostridia bacterium]
MIKLLTSRPGEGKTKEMIAHANKLLETAKGDVVFIGESNESILEINHNIRYIDISEYPLNATNEFNAFLHGLLGSNYDIQRVFLDGILNVFIMTPEEMATWLDEINGISDKYETNFEISISLAGDTPECLKKYL